MFLCKWKWASTLNLTVAALAAGTILFTTHASAWNDDSTALSLNTGTKNAAPIQRLQPKQPKKLSLVDFPPVVIKTVPSAGNPQVDPAKTKEIRVTFSKPMTDLSWSVVKHSNDTFPRLNGKVHYDKAKRTLIIPVKLDHGKIYVMWFNTSKHSGFRDKGGRPALPYQLVFKTKK